MNLQKTLGKFREVLPFYLEVGQKKALEIQLDPQTGGFRFLFRYDKLSPTSRQFLQLVATQSQSACCEVYCMSSMLAAGIKCFQLDATTVEALEQYEINIPCNEYHQPFRTFVFDLPPEYCDKRITMAERGPQKPQFAILHWEQEMRSIHAIISLDSDYSLTWHIHFDKPDLSIEEALLEHSRYVLSGLQKNEDENVLALTIIRAAINASIIATNYGTKAIGPENPNHFSRCQERLQKAIKRKDEKLAELNRQEIALMPFRYRFDQDVILYKKSKSVSEPGQPTGKRVAPHWRRGYYRQQRFGVGLTQSRRVAIPSVMVNADLLLGNECLSSVTYHLPNQAN
jgi:hypothetical protein